MNFPPLSFHANELIFEYLRARHDTGLYNVRALNACKLYVRKLHPRRYATNGVGAIVLAGFRRKGYA